MADTPDKPPMLLLHGVNGTQAEVQPWAEALRDDFATQTVNLLGHGGRPLPEAFGVEAFAQDLLAQMDARGLKAPVLLGYSFGGLLALYLAAHHPERVGAVVTVATKWHFDATTIRHVTYLFGIERLVAMKARAAQLAALHQPSDWKQLALRLSAMYTGFAQQPPLNAADLQRVHCPSLVLSGDSDPIVPLAETHALHRALRGSGLATHPGSAHPAGLIPVPGLRRAVRDWATHVGLSGVA